LTLKKIFFGGKKKLSWKFSPVEEKNKHPFPSKGNFHLDNFLKRVGSWQIIAYLRER